MQTKTNNTLEQMLFSSICFVVLILCSIGFLVNLLLTGNIVTISTSFASLVAISILCLFQKKISLEIGTLILILMGIVVINLFWFQTEGLNGVSPLLFVIYAVVITTVISTSRYIYFISFISINIATLIAIQVNFPEYVDTYPHVQTKEWDIIATVFTAIFMTTLAILFFKKNHLKNQAAIEEQNKTLLASQEELLRSKEKTEEANNLKFSFLAVINHEVRTPLNAIIGISHLLNQYDYDTAQKTELIAALNDSSQQLLSLLNEVLDFHKIESGEMKLHLQEAELSKIIENLRQELLERTIVPSPKPIISQPLPLEKEQKVLLVEDNKTNVLVLSHFLKKWGIAFEVANNGLEALAFYKNQPFKLILMDMQMPEMDGFEATQEIRKSNGKIPIIALTASATSQEQKRAELAGVNDYITKPFDPQHLHGVIQKYMLF